MDGRRRKTVHAARRPEERPKDASHSSTFTECTAAMLTLPSFAGPTSARSVTRTVRMRFSVGTGDLEHTWRGQPGPPAARACPDPAGAWYCTGIDWAQKRHYTVAAVVRCDTTPLQVVAVSRIQRRPWPEITERVGALLDEFPGPAVHDATGAGSAIGEFPALEAHRQLQGVTMVGRDRVDLFRNYIAAIERHEIVCPRIDVFYTEHLYCGEDDLFGSGHPPDTVVAMALAYHAFKTGRRPGDYGVTL